MPEECTSQDEHPFWSTTFGRRVLDAQDEGMNVWVYGVTEDGTAALTMTPTAVYRTPVDTANGMGRMECRRDYWDADPERSFEWLGRYFPQRV